MPWGTPGIHDVIAAAAVKDHLKSNVDPVADLQHGFALVGGDGKNLVLDMPHDAQGLTEGNILRPDHPLGALASEYVRKGLW